MPPTSLRSAKTIFDSRPSDSIVLSHFVRPGSIRPCVHEHMRAGACQFQRNGATDPARATGHDRGVAVERIVARSLHGVSIRSKSN